MYYAIERPYGVLALNTGGAQADKVRRFASRADRDDWVLARDTHREAVGASHPMVRRAKEDAGLGLEWPVGGEGEMAEHKKGRTDRFTWRPGDVVPVRNGRRVFDRQVGGIAFDIAVWADGAGDTWHWEARRAGEDAGYASGVEEGYEDVDALVTDVTWTLFSMVVAEQESGRRTFHGVAEDDEGWELADLDHAGRCGRGAA